MTTERNLHVSSPQWLLVEAFDRTREPTIIGFGSTTRTFVPLSRVIRSPTHLAVVHTALEGATESDFPTNLDFTQNGTRYLLRPLSNYLGYTPAFLVHYGPDSEPVRPFPRCGAWAFNVTEGTAHGSDDLLDLYQVPHQQRATGRPLHEAFQRLVGNDNEAIRKLIDKTPGVTHQATEIVTTDSGTHWIAGYSCRFVQATPAGDIYLHGVTQRIGDYEPTAGDRAHADLSANLLAAMSLRNTWRIVADPHTGTILRTYDGYPPGVPPTTDVADLFAEGDFRSAARTLLGQCARQQRPIRGLTTVGPGGVHMDMDLYPVDLGQDSAILVATQIPEL